MRYLVLLLTGAVAMAAVSSGYVNEIRAWRKAREAGLKADDGWLTVAGLFWLSDGANTAGTDPSSAIMLPAGSRPLMWAYLNFTMDAPHSGPSPAPAR